MITLDLFESPGTPEDPRPQAAYIPVTPEKPGARNRALGNANLAILMKAIGNVDANSKPAPIPARLNFLDGRSYPIDPKYYPEIIQYYRTLSDVERVNFIYRTLTSYNKTIKFLNTLAQGTLFEKTNAEQSSKDKYKDAVVQRAVTQARADFPSAASDEEAFIKSVMVKQDQDQKNIDRLNSSTQRAQTLINKNDELDQTQAQAIDNIQAEINRVEQDNDTLQQMVQRMGRANAQLQATLDKMRQRPGAAPAVEPTLGVSVATDKVAEPVPAEEPAQSSPIDVGARQKLNDLSKAVTMSLLKLQDKNQTQDLSDAERQRLEQLEKRLKQIEKAQSLVQNARKKGTRLSKKAGDAAMTAIAQAMGGRRTSADVAPINPTNIEPAPAIEPRPTSAEKKSNVLKFLPKDLTGQDVPANDNNIPEPELKFNENEAKLIPQKMVVQGYSVEYDPAQRLVTVSRRGRVVGRALNKSGSYNNYQLATNRIINASEEDKYPDDLESRSVERSVGESTEELSAQDILFRTAAKAMYDARQQGVDLDYEEAIRIASRLMRIPYAPSMIPALQAQLDDVKKKIATMKSVRKNQRQREREKLTHQTTADEERRRQEWMKNYGDSLRRRLQTRQTESKEKKHSEAWEQGGREGYYGRPNKNPYQSGTQEYQDYNRGYNHYKDDGKDYLRELDLDRSGQPMYQRQEVYMLTHNGREVAFYKLKDLKRAEQDAQGMQQKLGGEVHIRKVMREAEQPQDEVMKRLFKDFGDIFGKQPPQPKAQEPEKKEVKEMNRAGYNPLTSEEHWAEVKNHLTKLLSAPGMSYADKEVIRQRYNEKAKKAREKGWEK